MRPNQSLEQKHLYLEFPCQEMDKKSVTDDENIKQLEAEVENLSPKPRKKLKVELKKEDGKWKINDEIQDLNNRGKYG